MYKNRLQELCQKKYWAMPKYTANKVGSDHNPRFTASVLVNGVSFETTQFSRSSKEAQSEAARLAFEHFTTPEPLSLKEPSVAIPGTQLPQGSTGGSSEMNEAAVPNGRVQPESRMGLLSLKEPSAIAGIQLPKGSTSGSRELNEAAVPNGRAQSESPEMLEDFHSNGVNLDDFHSNGVNLSVTHNIEVKDMLHLCKNQLRSLAQRRNMQLPLYSCARDGPPHALRFKATVSVGGQTFESPEFFRTVREAEHAAAKVALMELSAGVQEGEHSFYKTMLQELAAKQGFSLQYNTITSGASHMPTFFSTVEVDGEVFSGKAAKTKKQAEMNAAKAALSKLNDRKSTWMQQSGQHISFSDACVIVDLPPKRSPQATYNPAPSFSIQAPIELEDNHHENAGISTSSSSCRAPGDVQSSVTPDSLPNVGSISNSVQMMKTGSKDESDVSTGEPQVSESFQSLNMDKAGIHNLITSAARKSSTDAVPQNVELPSSYNTKPSNKSDMTYASLRDPFPDGHSDTEYGMSSPSMSSEHLDAFDPPNGPSRWEHGPTFLGNRIQVYSHSENMTLPKGAIILPISDDEWVAAKLEFPKGVCNS